nr:MAG TPA: VP4-like protein [Caudoviricetes sp.]
MYPMESCTDCRVDYTVLPCYDVITARDNNT